MPRAFGLPFVQVAIVHSFPIKLCEIWLAFAPLAPRRPAVSPPTCPRLQTQAALATRRRVDTLLALWKCCPNPTRARRAEPPAVERRLGSVQVSLLRPVMGATAARGRIDNDATPLSKSWPHHSQTNLSGAAPRRAGSPQLDHVQVGDRGGPAKYAFKDGPSRRGPDRQHKSTIKPTVALVDHKADDVEKRYREIRLRQKEIERQRRRSFVMEAQAPPRPPSPAKPRLPPGHGREPQRVQRMRKLFNSAIRRGVPLFGDGASRV